MARMLNSRDEYTRALKVVSALESKVKSGDATERERERYRDGVDHCLIYEWAEQGKWERQQLDMGRSYEELYRKSERGAGRTGGRGADRGRNPPVRVGQPASSGVVAHLRRTQEQGKQAGS